MRSSTQLNNSPLLIQDEVAALPPADRNALKDIYEKQASGSYRDYLRSMQQRSGINANAPIGGGFGKLPDFDRLLEVLAKSVPSHRSVQRCAVCDVTPAMAQVSPCDHFLCEGCSSELRRDLAKGHGDCLAIGCEQEPDGVEDLDAGTSEAEAEPASGAQPSDNGQASEKSGNASVINDWMLMKGVPMPSTKMVVIKLKILEWLWKDPSVKCIIFSRSLGM